MGVVRHAAGTGNCLAPKAISQKKDVPFTRHLICVPNGQMLASVARRGGQGLLCWHSRCVSASACMLKGSEIWLR